MTKEDFIKICSDRKFWQWIKNKSLVPYEKIQDKNKFLNNIYKKINTRTYYPNPPKEYLTLNKNQGVLRIVPVLQLEDLCVYYYCARKLEKYIALDHVPGTYGGYGINGKLMHIEAEEIIQIKDAIEIVEFENQSYAFSEMGGYPMLSSFNPRAWYAEWNDFTKKLYFNAPNFTNGFVAEIDISNFYDSIQLDGLEFKLRKHVPNKNTETIYLLLHFLRFWNRHINFYRQQGAGIPQDIFGECSRIFANFYLQNYDNKISKYCAQRNGKYFRYADDQIIFAQSRKDLEEMIVKASSFLMREGLNLNQKKIKIMSIRGLKKYYAFDNFLALAETKTKPVQLDELKKQINFYFKNKDTLRKNGASLLKRILGILGKRKKRPANFLKLKKHLLSKEFLLESSMTASDFQKVYKLINKKEKQKMINTLNQAITTCLYSKFLYEIRAFYTLSKQPIRNIRSRIGYLKKFYGFEKASLAR